MKVCQLNPVNFSCRTMGVPWEIQTVGGRGFNGVDPWSILEIRTECLQIFVI